MATNNRTVDTEQARNAFHDVPGFEDRLRINRQGVVWSKDRYVNSPICGGSRLIKAIPLVILSARGYPAVQVRKDRKKVTVYIHRAMACLFVPNPEGKPDVNHIDGDKSNFDPSNLEWCTHAENMRHAFDTGLATYPVSGPGEMSPAAKLNDLDVSEIKRRLRNGERSADLAREFGVKKGTIGHIKSGSTWSHVQ